MGSKVIFNKKVAPGHYVMRLKAPTLAKTVRPGQFVQVDVGAGGSFLRRPFSILSAIGDTIDILYAVVGKGTEVLSKKKTGDSIDILGPLGNSWSSVGAIRRVAPTRGRKAILIGGGVGIPPLYFLAQREMKHRGQIEVFLGARHQSLLLCQKDFQKLGIPVHVATDDGSVGFKGYVTELVKRWFLNSEQRTTNDERRYLYACGPEPMLKAVAKLAKEWHLEGEVSMESPMACGFGVCVGCAIPVVGGKYKLCCYNGTVFKINEVDWDKI